MSIGENLKKLRTQRELSQYHLAEKIGVNQSMIAQIERGTKSLTLALAKDIVSILNCKLEDLLQ